MPLVKCRLCGNLYNSNGGGIRVCKNCMRRIDSLYGHVHEYMRDHEDDDFDIYTLADALNISTADVQVMVDLGYIERDLQTYGKDKKGSKEKLAQELNNELDKMRRNVTTYGGVIYGREREKNDARQYVYDSQKTFRK